MGKGEAGNLYQFTDPVQHRVQMLLAHGVVAPGVVVGGILLARDQLVGVEELAVGAGADLVWGGGRRLRSEGWHGRRGGVCGDTT